ncbi:hypothetical protein HZA43_05380 [Candidatus Peregrinibacteria bacterium]|nr:hypothetical protein [Candidatus Peregrinibacteria bacterium]
MHKIDSKLGTSGDGAEGQSPIAIDEGYRQKVTALRDGVRRMLSQHEIFLEPGVSNSDLLVALSRTMGLRDRMPEYREDLSLDWRDEYWLMIAQIGVILSHSEVSVETEPQDIVNSIEERLAA